MSLPPEVEELILSLKREIEALRAENAELRRRLGLDSSTSSKPPSSDGLKKAGLPVDQQQEVAAQAQRLIEDEMTLRDLRKAHETHARTHG
jgi:regulator of replication initiation timing